MEFERILSPIKIGTMELNNRFVVPPMGTNFGTYEGYVTQQMIDYYTARAKGGFGLIILEVTAVNKKGKAILNELGLWEDEQIEGMKKLVDSIHEAGGKVVVQLHHAGRQTVPDLIWGEQPVAPSKVACPVMNCTPQALSNQEVWDTIEEFGDAALRAKQAGFDGVEIHGGHGYLVAQFMSTHSNKRFDEFGADFEGRMKFPVEIFKNVRKKCGEDYPMLFRYSYDEKVNGGRTLEESTAIARVAEANGVNALDITIMTYASMPYMTASAAMPAGFNQYPTQQIKNSVAIPVITVGRFNNMYVAEDVLKNERADLVAFGRESIGDPEIPNKVKEGRINEISPCIACLQSCLSRLTDPNYFKISCLVNPLTGHEGEYDLSVTPKKKKVLVAGSGPAGLEAAWVAAKRGHDVVVYEKEEDFGGQFRLAAIPPTKHELLTMLKYYMTMGKKHGVKYNNNTAVTKSLVETEKPDVVILATGGQPMIPPIPGIDGDNVVTAIDVLDGKAVTGQKVLVIGGGMVGVETADFLGEHGREVTIMEMRNQIAIDVEPAVGFWLMQRLEQWKINNICNAKVEEFTADGVKYSQGDSSMELAGFDTIVLAMGVKAYNPLEEELQGAAKELYVIGDAKMPGQANLATEAGLAVALKI